MLQLLGLQFSTVPLEQWNKIGGFSLNFRVEIRPFGFGHSSLEKFPLRLPLAVLCGKSYDPTAKVRKVSDAKFRKDREIRKSNIEYSLSNVRDQTRQ